MNRAKVSFQAKINDQELLRRIDNELTKKCASVTQLNITKYNDLKEKIMKQKTDFQNCTNINRLPGGVTHPQAAGRPRPRSRSRSRSRDRRGRRPANNNNIGRRENSSSAGSPNIRPQTNSNNFVSQEAQENEPNDMYRDLARVMQRTISQALQNNGHQPYRPLGGLIQNWGRGRGRGQGRVGPRRR